MPKTQPVIKRQAITAELLLQIINQISYINSSVEHLQNSFPFINL